MLNASKGNSATLRRKRRTRYKIIKSCRISNTCRLSVHKSGLHLYAQIINDNEGKTLASASTLEQVDTKTTRVNRANIDHATTIGQKIAERAVAKGISRVVFDRGSHKYHGIIKTIADAARSAGLQF